MRDIAQIITAYISSSDIKEDFSCINKYWKEKRMKICEIKVRHSLVDFVDEIFHGIRIWE